MTQKKPRIDDSVRRSFPGKTDAEIEAWWFAAKAAELAEPEGILASDFFLARIVRALGWSGFESYLDSTVGTHELDHEDFVAIVEAIEFIELLDTIEGYSAMFATASEATNKKTVTSRKKSMKEFTKRLDNHRIVEEV